MRVCVCVRVCEGAHAEETHTHTNTYIYICIFISVYKGSDIRVKKGTEDVRSTIITRDSSIVNLIILINNYPRYMTMLYRNINKDVDY